MRTAVLALCALTCLESAAQAQVASYYGKELIQKRWVAYEATRLFVHGRPPVGEQ